MLNHFAEGSDHMVHGFFVSWCKRQPEIRNWSHEHDWQKNGTTFRAKSIMVRKPFLPNKDIQEMSYMLDNPQSFPYKGMKSFFVPLIHHGAIHISDHKFSAGIWVSCLHSFDISESVSLAPFRTLLYFSLIGARNGRNCKTNNFPCAAEFSFLSGNWNK